MLAIIATCAFPKSSVAQGYTIPVVFHVLYNNSFDHISDAQVMDGLNVLNTGFNQAGNGNEVPPFDAIAASMDITFCLASTAPDGSPTTGIEWIETTWADHGGAPESYMNQWPRDRYLNIWVVGAIETGVYEQGAYPPEEADADIARDGIMIWNQWLGSIGTSTPSVANSIIFMAGRYLGLRLLWEEPTGNGDCGDDGVADTPPCEPILSCIDLDLPSCDSTMIANVQNYMTYSYCTTMFTLGQKARVDSVLNSPLAQRNNLWTASNLALTGCGPMSIHDRDPYAGLSLKPLLIPGRWELCFPNETEHTVHAFDVMGRTVGAWHARDRLVVDLSSQPPGVYLLRTVSQAGEVRSGNLVRP